MKFYSFKSFEKNKDNNYNGYKFIYYNNKILMSVLFKNGKKHGLMRISIDTLNFLPIFMKDDILCQYFKTNNKSIDNNIYFYEEDNIIKAYYLCNNIVPFDYYKIESNKKVIESLIDLLNIGKIQYLIDIIIQYNWDNYHKI